MKRALALGSIPAVAAMFLQTGVAHAATQSIHNVALKKITYTGIATSQAYSFAAYDGKYLTAYMPIWYVSGILQKAGIASTWNGKVWNLSVPNTFKLDVSHSPGPATSPYNNTTIQMNGQSVQHMHSIAYKDPMGSSVTTYVPIWYIEQALRRVGLQSTWDGKTWTITSTQSFTNVDLRYNAPANISAANINQFLQSHGSPLAGLGQSFIDAQNLYGVDANYLVSHSILESGWGKSQISLVKNNLFGYGAYDANPGNDAGLFPSNDYAIRFEAWVVRQNYLNPGSSHYVAPTLGGMNVNYASDPNWADSIGQIMAQIAAVNSGSVANYVQYQGNNAPVLPVSTSSGGSSTGSIPGASAGAPLDAEPVFYLAGAQAVTQPNANYTGVPYYPDMATGMQQMFFAPLQLGSANSGVAEMQRYLNQQIAANLPVDGQFGPLTLAAVKQFQQLHGFPQTGIWDYTLWQLIYPTGANIIPSGTSVAVDQIMQGMANGYVVAWYHIPNYGWVDSQYVQLNNVYRVAVPNPTGTSTTVNVYDPNNPTRVLTTLHNGDFVVTADPNPVNGQITIQLASQAQGAAPGVTPGQPAGQPTGVAPGQAMAGVIQQADATLVQQP
ncbi:MAG: hypothetical protein A2201_06365 [Alicyclobacillus sp. RIFOXYA1_FULL_53_8]|nr:MAG: hypothetical protein A2201_06365 [Alicyclobacillus sp. RIFOXYA1_FULL_53_8]